MKKFIQSILISMLLFSGAVSAAEEILAATTSSGNSSSFTVNASGDRGNSATIIIYAASGHTAGEYSDVQISHDGSTWADLYYDGTQVRLSSTNTAVTVYGPGVFRVAKEATTNATGVYVSKWGDL